jgi:hypothetical protein
MATITRWKKLKSETGSLNKKELNRRARKYDSEKLISYTKENPFACLKDIAESFNGTTSGVSAALSRLKIRKKKRQLRIQSGMTKNEKSLTKK